MAGKKPRNLIKKGVGFSLSEEVLKEIDRRRGRIPRSRYVEDDLLRPALGMEVTA